MKIEVLVGMIASGKSTYALARAKEGALVVSHDDLTEMLHGEYRYEQGLRDCYRRMEEDLAYTAIGWKRDIVIDRTHLTRESRERWIEFAIRQRNAPEIVAVRFPVHDPKTHADRRWSSDPRGRLYEDWLKVARHHYEQAQAEPLTGQEGFDQIIYYSGLARLVINSRQGYRRVYATEELPPSDCRQKEQPIPPLPWKT